MSDLCSGKYIYIGDSGDFAAPMSMTRPDLFATICKNVKAGKKTQDEKSSRSSLVGNEKSSECSANVVTSGQFHILLPTL